MEKEICKISISAGSPAETYVFYENETIKKISDQEYLDSENSEWLEAGKISKMNKDRIIRNCPEECKERIMLILDYP